MFETEIADFVEAVIDEAGGSSRRWAMLLVVTLAGALGLLWFAKRAATDDVVRLPDASGPG